VQPPRKSYEKRSKKKALDFLELESDIESDLEDNESDEEEKKKQKRKPKNTKKENIVSI